jgi:hypothetical protein
MWVEVLPPHYLTLFEFLFFTHELNSITKKTVQKMQISKLQVREMADLMNAGHTIYVNKDTGEFKALFELVDLMGYMTSDEADPWKEQRQIIASWERSATIEKLPSHEGFRIMESFADEVDDMFRDKIIYALNRRKPFAHFKYLVESSEYRHQWFDFKRRKYEEYIIENLLDNGLKVE